jgi:NADH-quinone oxidoreductase subunit L
MIEGQIAGFQCMTDCGPSMIAQMLWLIPAVPIVASGVIALLKQPRRKTAATLAIGSLAFSLLLSLAAFANVLTHWVGLSSE